MAGEPAAPSGPPPGPVSGPSAGPTSGAGSGPTSESAASPPGVDGAGQQPPAGPPPRTLVSGSGGGHRPPWWRRPRSLVAAGALVVLAVVLAVVLVERQPKTGQATVAAPKATLQAAGSPGPDPFTGSVAVAASRTASSSPASSSPASPSPVVSASGSASGSGSVDGGSVGLYGGTERSSSCDVPQLSAFLTSHPDKGQAWAGVEGITLSDLPGYLNSLTPAVLRVDTRVTNHGFAAGAATSFQSVLQAGSAVLVDSRGVPRARCACGNPLLPPIEGTTVGFAGTPWPGFHAESVVTVKPAAAPVHTLVMVDQDSGSWFGRPVGSTGGDDTAVQPPSGSPSRTASASASASAAASAATSAATSTSASASGTSTKTSHSAGTGSSAPTSSAHTSSPATGGGAGTSYASP